MHVQSLLVSLNIKIQLLNFRRRKNRVNWTSDEKVICNQNLIIFVKILLKNMSIMNELKSLIDGAFVPSETVGSITGVCRDFIV